MAGKTIEMPTRKAHLRIAVQRTDTLTDSLTLSGRKLALAVLTNMGVQNFERAKEFPALSRENLSRVNVDDEQALSTTSDFMRASAARIFGDHFDPREWEQTMLRSSGELKQGISMTPSVSPYARGLLHIALTRLQRLDNFDTALEYIAAKTHFSALKYVAAKTYFDTLKEEHTDFPSLQPASVTNEHDAKEQAMAERLAVYAEAQGLTDQVHRLNRIATRLQSVTSREAQVRNEPLTENLSQMLQNLGDYARAHYSGKKQTLRELQMDVFDDIRISVERGEREGYIEAPTGFGKTVLFGEVVAAANVPTVIVVPRKRLVEQAYRSIKRFNPELSVGRVYGDKKEFGHQVTITTYQTLTNDIDGQRVPFNEAAMIILDEVDEATGQERIKAIERIPENAFLLGFSATPVKVMGEDFANSRVAKMMNNEIDIISLREGVEEGYLSSFSSYIVNVESDISDVSVTDAGNYNEGELESVINTPSHNQAAVKFFLEARQKDREKQRAGGKTAILPFTTSVYAASIKHAQDLAEEFQAAGVSAAAVWGKQNPREQEEIMRKWEAGEIEVVCSKDLLVRGNDIPKIRLVMNVAPTASFSVEKQRCGRGLRLDESNPDKHTIIADFVYLNSSRTSHQVTFAEIADGAAIYRHVAESEPQSRTNTRRKKGSNPDASDPNFAIEGLQIITDVHEVMRLVKGLISQREAFSELEETDFPVTQKSLERMFTGGDRKLRPIADAVVEEIRRELPGIVVLRRSVGVPVTAVTNADLFIKKMVEKGASIRDDSIQPVQTGDIVINATFIRTNFVGGHRKIGPISDAVLEEMRTEHPGSVAARRNVNVTTTVVLDIDLYFEKMTARKVERKDSAKQEVKQSEVAVTNRWLQKTFIGNVIRVRSIADEVIGEIEKTQPAMVRWQRSSNRLIPIIGNETYFIQEMQKRDVKLYDASVEVIAETDVPMTSTYLLAHFQGAYEKLRTIKDEVLDEIRQEHPELITQKKKKNDIITVVTDADVFTQKMLDKGVKLRGEKR